MSSKPVSKSSDQSARQAAAAAFQSQSTLSLESTESAVPAEQEGRRRLANTYLIQRERLIPDPDQPRKEFQEKDLGELTRSIESRGIKQPLTVRWSVEHGQYMIIDGGRRFEAAKRLKLDELPCWIQKGERSDILIDQVVHNWQRSDLRPYETADALARLRDEFGMTQSDIVRLTGKSKAEISKFLALHDKVVPEVQEAARSGAEPLTSRHLYNISKLKPDQQQAIANEVNSQNLTAQQTERLIARQSPKVTPNHRVRNVNDRQRRFSTSKADVLMTFRRKAICVKDIQTALSEIAEHLKTSEG
jgi:ParB family chromosome partitioning protein